MEEWIARRIDSPHVLKPCPASRPRRYLYIVTEFVEGQTLAQWMIDHPKPDLETVRGIVEQIAKGLRAFHRMEMLHQDLRPANVMIDKTGTVKIIDFGSVAVAGVAEAAPGVGHDGILGTEQYAAPEYFLGEAGSSRSDQFSLGVIAYQMLTGQLPYGAKAARVQNAGASPKARLPLRPRRRARNPGLDRRRPAEGSPSQPGQALRKPVRVPVRPTPPERRLSRTTLQAAGGTQSAAVLEGHDHRAGDRAHRVAGRPSQPATDVERPRAGRGYASSVAFAAIGFGAAPPPGFMRNS